MAQSIASDDNGNQNDRNGNVLGFNGQLQQHISYDISQTSRSVKLGDRNDENNQKEGNRKQRKDNSVLVIQTYVSPEEQGSFHHGIITDNVIQDLDKSGNTTEDKKRQVLSIQTYTSPEGESLQQGIVTHTVFSELDKPGSHRKSKEKDSKSGKDLPIQFSPESPVLAVQTTISPDGQPPFFKGEITNTVYTKLEKSKEHHFSKNQTLDHTTSKFNKDHKDGHVLTIQTVISPEGQTPFQHGTITKTLVSELDNPGLHREKSNINKSKNKLSRSSKGRSSTSNRSESPVLAVETITSPDGQPPFFKGTITNTVYTELHKAGVHKKQDVPSPNLHKNNNTEAGETEVLY